MPRPTHIHISTTALLHNVTQIKRQAPNSQFVAVVKCNAYGCGINYIVPPLVGHVDKLAVASMEEALAIRQLGVRLPIVILQGVFKPHEWQIAAEQKFECVLHNPQQLAWLCESPLSQHIKVWLKINTGMNRLGFIPDAIPEIITKLLACAWVDTDLILMTHFANADEPKHSLNSKQQAFFTQFKKQFSKYQFSFNNSAAIFSSPATQGNFIRPGLALYGVSPFINQTGRELGLRPVMQFVSEVSHIFSIPKGASVGYGSTWKAERPSQIAIIPVGYGDGYHRSIQPNTPVLINGMKAPIIGRVSMDVMTVDITSLPAVALGSPVELWGPNLPVEQIAEAAGTIPYELLVQVNRR